jgi:hypothetical protein
MSSILVPSRHPLHTLLREPRLLVPGQIPRVRVQINWRDPIWLGLSLCWVAGQRVNLVDGRPPDMDGTMLQPAPMGLSAYFPETAAGSIVWQREYVTTSDGSGNGDFTFVAFANPAAETDYSCICGQKWDSAGGPYAQAVLSANSSALYSPVSGYLAFITYSNGRSGVETSAVVDGDWHVFAGIRSGAAMTLDVDGVQKSTGTPTVRDISDGKRYTLIGNGGKGSDTDAYNGNQAIVLMWNRALSVDERVRINQILRYRLDLLVEPINRSPLIFDLGGGGGGATLSINNSSHTQSADTIALTQANVLAVADAAHTQTPDSVALAQANLLVVADALNAQSADAVALSSAGSLSIDGAFQAQTADSVALAQANLLAVANALHTQSADVAVLSSAGSLSIDGAFQAQSADSFALTQANLLALADALHGQTADPVVLTQANLLAIHDATQAQSAGAVVLESGLTLAVASSLHAQSAGSLALTQAHVLATDDAAHTQNADSPVLVLGFSLAPDDALHAQSADNVTLDIAWLLSVASAAHAQTAENVDLSAHATLVLASAEHSQSADTLFLITGVPVTASSRVLVVSADDRTLSVTADDRILTIH